MPGLFAGECVMEPTWQSEDGRVRLWNADTLSHAPKPAKSVAVVSDPPYGMNWNTDSSRFSGGKGHHHKESPRVHGDDNPFDPSPWLEFDECILWGANHFGDRLPRGTTLVWLKKSMEKLGQVLSDCEIAWQRGGHGVYAFRCVWDGCARETENGTHWHPVQKPVALMEWCIERLNAETIVDPFMGSGSTILAAIRQGRSAEGWEIDPQHFATAQRRIQEALGMEVTEPSGIRQRRMFVE